MNPFAYSSDFHQNLIYGLDKPAKVLRFVKDRVSNSTCCMSELAQEILPIHDIILSPSDASAIEINILLKLCRRITPQLCCRVSGAMSARILARLQSVRRQNRIDTVLIAP
jgi:hypothetical protein